MRAAFTCATLHSAVRRPCRNKQALPPRSTTSPTMALPQAVKLENAAYAVFSSNLGNGDVVDENGRFLLQDGETVTFNDQFRRGSYIALQEQIDTELYDTTWTVYENGVPVTNVSGKADVVTTGSVSTLQNISGTAPNDGRTEKAVDATLDGHNTKNEYTEAKKPSTALVFALTAIRPMITS